MAGDAVGLVDLLAALGLRRGVRRLSRHGLARFGSSCAASRTATAAQKTARARDDARYARMSFTTSPDTSVRRKSRPA